MSPLKIALMLAVFGLTACDGAKAPATVPDTSAGTLDADAAHNAGATPEAVKFPNCVQPSNQGLGAEEIASGCYTVCRVGGTGEHPIEGGTQKGEHLRKGDGVEIGKVSELTMVNVRPNNEGARPGNMRPDEHWPMLGSAQKTKVEGARSFWHDVGGATVEVPHKIRITKLSQGNHPTGCDKPNIIKIEFCTDMFVNEGGGPVTKFECAKPGDPEAPSGDQGHVHAEN